MASGSLQSRYGSYLHLCALCYRPMCAAAILSVSSEEAEQVSILLQVSHHPPISAAHAENDKWVYDIVSAPSTKFMGNSVEIYPVGMPHHFSV